MYINSLKLLNFRNYETLELNFGKGINIFKGDNAQGKTNLLEAIYFCACARSHRTGNDFDLIKHGADNYRITLDFTDRLERQNKISYEFFTAKQRGEKNVRKMFFNDIPVRKISEMMGLFHSVIFAPEDLQIIKGGPVNRRRYLDLLLAQTDNTYFRALQSYVKLLQQRNFLLKKLRDSFGKTEELDVWDFQIAKQASYILLKRYETVKEIAEISGEIIADISDKKEKLELLYKSFLTEKKYSEKCDLENIYLQKLLQSRDDDILRGSTGIGPHRDDIEIKLNGAEARIFASQGQQRSIVLALKIAEFMILKNQTLENPVLLLDDVMSELDIKRQNRLIKIIDGHQVFITGTDFTDLVTKFSTAGEISFFHIDSGTVHSSETHKNAII